MYVLYKTPAVGWTAIHFYAQFLAQKTQGGGGIGGVGGSTKVKGCSQIPEVTKVFFLWCGERWGMGKNVGSSFRSFAL